MIGDVREGLKAVDTEIGTINQQLEIMREKQITVEAHLERLEEDAADILDGLKSIGFALDRLHNGEGWRKLKSGIPNEVPVMIPEGDLTLSIPVDLRTTREKHPPVTIREIINKPLEAEIKELKKQLQETKETITILRQAIKNDDESQKFLF